MLRRLTLSLAVALVATGSTPAAEAARPITIPAVREWTDRSGNYTFGALTKIVYSHAALSDEASVFAGDLKRLTGFTISAIGGTTPNAGDIYLTLGATDTAIGDEGYLLTVADRITVSARAEGGAFYGTRTILQLLKKGFTVAAGTARDWPMYKLRGMHVDNGRKYFTPAWLRDHVRELGYLKMNVFHLHLSDREGFRVESTMHPEVPTTPYLTRAEVSDLVTFALSYKVTIIPEIDAPAHLTAALRNHPELWQNGSNAGQLELGLDASFAFMEDLYEEFIPLFPGPYWHIGADEYNLGSDTSALAYAQSHYCAPNVTAVWGDAVVGFVNRMNAVVKAAGKTAWAWHDVARIVTSCTRVDTDIVIDFWNWEPTSILPAGYKVFNSNRWFTYYVLGGANNTPQEVYEKWSPAVFGKTIADAHPQNLGGKGLHIWCDNPTAETEAQIAAAAYQRLRGAGQTTWSSPKLTAKFPQFKPMIEAVGRAPGYGEHLGN